MKVSKKRYVEDIEDLEQKITYAEKVLFGYPENHPETVKIRTYIDNLKLKVEGKNGRQKV